VTRACQKGEDGEGEDAQTTFDHKVVEGARQFEQTFTALTRGSAVLRVAEVQVERRQGRGFSSYWSTSGNGLTLLEPFERLEQDLLPA
jgi:hypothetical protein